jgi:TonB family protein
MKKTLGTLGLLAMATASICAQLVPQPDKDGVYWSGKGLTLSKLTHAADAVYPSDPSLAAIKHVCAVRVAIGADGIPGAIQVLNQRASPFDDAAFAAVKQSQFEPGSYEGNTVPTYITLWIPFNLGNDVAPIVVTRTLNEPSAPVALNSVRAEFPKQARKEKIDQGVVLVQVLVTEEGLPTNATIVKPAGHGFDENAFTAVGRYRFKPATLHGVPVPMDIMVEVIFRRY